MATPAIVVKALLDQAKNKKFWILLLCTFLALSLLIIMSVLAPFIAMLSLGNSEDTENKLPVTEEVKAYAPHIKIALVANGLSPNWEAVIQAIMMQESAGKGLDPMQSAECGFNTKYPNKPNGIQDPLYSVTVGIQNFASLINKVGIKEPTDDINKLKIALQAYNFGAGYINYTDTYSLENASEFSKKQQDKLGWSKYGDIYYVPHVWRYLPLGLFGSESGSSSDDFFISSEPGQFSNPLKPGTYRFTQAYKGKGHYGVDLGAPEGVSIYAAADGYVEFASFGIKGQGFGGYGNCVLINHKNGYYTLYGHASKLHVSKGQYVKKGQLIAEVGNTGNSFGNHLHFEVRTGFQSPRINPSQFIKF